MSIPNPAIKCTYEDYLNAPEDKRYELLDGALVVTPAPGEPHQRVSIRLGSKLFQFVTENRLGEVYPAPFDVVLSDLDVVQPDLIFVSNARAHIITPANIQGGAGLGRRNPVSLDGGTRQDVQICAIRRVRRGGVLDSGYGRKNHNGPVAGRAWLCGRGYLRGGGDVGGADVGGLRVDDRRCILRDACVLRCRENNYGEGSISKSAGMPRCALKVPIC